MWRPTNHTPEAIARFRERREEAGIKSVVCHALYLVNLASPDPVIYGKSIAAMRSSLEAASAIGAEGRDLPRRLAPRGRVRGGPRARRAGSEGAARADDRRPLAADGELGRRRRHDRTLDRRARRDPRRARSPSPARALPRLVPLVRLRRRRHRQGSPRRRDRGDRRPDRARPASLPARQRLEGTARVEPRPPRDDRRRADRRRRPADVPRPPGVPGASRDPRDARPRRARAGCGRGSPPAGACTAPEPGRPAEAGHRPAARATQACGSICANTRKLGRATGISKNSGFRQPTSSPRCS